MSVLEIWMTTELKIHNNKNITQNIVFNFQPEATSRCRQTGNRNKKKTEICVPSKDSSYVLAIPE